MYHFISLYLFFRFLYFFSFVYNNHIKYYITIIIIKILFDEITKIFILSFNICTETYFFFLLKKIKKIKIRGLFHRD